MSLNQIYDNSSRLNDIPVRFKNVKLGGESLSNVLFSNDRANINFQSDYVNNKYISAYRGNSELYGYGDDSFTVEEIIPTTFGGTLHQVSTEAELLSAIASANDYDRIQLMNNITLGLTSPVSVPLSLEIFSVNDYLLINVTGVNLLFDFTGQYYYFHDFGVSNISGVINSYSLKFSNANDIVFKNMRFSVNKNVIQLNGGNFYCYDSNFYHLSSPSSVDKHVLSVIKSENQVVNFKRCILDGDGLTDTNTSFVSINPVVSSDVDIKIIIDDCNLGTDILVGKGIKFVCDFITPCQTINVVLNSNTIVTKTGAVRIANNEFLGSCDILQAYNNNIKMIEGYENDFTGVFYALPYDSGGFSFVDNEARIRAYKNVVPESTKENAVPNSAYDNAILTSEYGFVPVAQFKKLNPLFIATISTDYEPGVGYVQNPLNENMLGNNFDILGLRKLQSGILQSTGSTISVVNTLEMNGNNISSFGLLSGLELRGDKIKTNTPGADLVVGSKFVPENTLIEIGEPFNRFLAIFAEGLWANTLGSATTTNVALVTDIIPQVSTIKVGTTANPFDEIVGDTLTTDNLQAVTGTDLTLYSDILPAIQGTINLGNNGQRFNNLYADYSYISVLNSTNPYLEINTSLVPSSNGYTLGLSNDAWNELHCTEVYTERLRSDATGDIFLYGNLVPSASASYILGGAGNKFLKVFTDETDSDVIKTSSIYGISGSIQFFNSFRPNSANTRDIGTPTSYFKETYTKRITTDAIDGLTSTNVTLQGNLNPDLNNTRTLGNATSVYKEVHNRTYLSDVTLVFTPYNNGNTRFQMSETYFRTIGDNVHSLGLAGNRFTTAYITNGVVTGSSREIKKDIVDCKMGLEWITKMEPKMYRYIDDEDDAPMRCGLVYEDVKQVVDESNMSFRGLHETTEEVMDEEGNGTGEMKQHVGINYESFISPLITAVKELKAEVDKLKEEIAILKSK